MKQVQLKDGRSALNLIPDYSGQLAIVSFEVLKRLAALLDNSNAYMIISSLIGKLGDLNRDDITDRAKLEHYVQLLEDEVAFHKSVNLINTIKPEDIKSEGELSDKAQAMENMYADAGEANPLG